MLIFLDCVFTGLPEMSKGKRKKGQKKGSGDEVDDPKHPNNDPRTGISRRQRIARKERGVENSEVAKKKREEKEQSKQSEKREQREKEIRPPKTEPVVEPGNEIQNEVFETVPEGKIELNPRSI